VTMATEKFIQSAPVRWVAGSLPMRHAPDGRRDEPGLGDRGRTA